MTTPRIQTTFATPSRETLFIGLALALVLSCLFGGLLIPMPARPKA